ncbi:PREDICTED: dynein intermediate chain 2, ciliary-like [Priapulus caudatus]|uniref:Dynein intermediate chain 2, ciliary-like n=1 Tax=Priapulus caudatus TaxID=37621 RepID=A0ABM1DY50_PRICU|nr:PREDICTED: dynein intermediate chain 2, ciliary-like [Priapulus caudatus]
MMKKSKETQKLKVKLGQGQGDQLSYMKVPIKKASRKPSIFLKAQPENIAEEYPGLENCDEWTDPRERLKPADQLQLNENELNEEFTRILTANNPNAPENVIRYSFNERCFKQVTYIEQMAVHFAADGCMLHKNSDEARRQQARGETGVAIITDAQAEGEDNEENAEEQTGKEEVPEQEAERSSTLPPNRDAKKLTNQFNFSERASQTYNNPYREHETQTQPPPRTTFGSGVTQWEIFDAYAEDFAYQQLEKNKDKAKSIVGQKDGTTVRKKVLTSELQTNDMSLVARAAKIVERMVNQNSYDEIAQDFRYWEDMSDEFRENEGTLLPLWRFITDCTKRLAVTSVCWNPFYDDLFTASYGSYDFMMQPKGCICCFSLKNPSFPEFSFKTNYGVMSIDVHPSYPHLIVAGCYDGSVAVYNSKVSSEAIHCSNAETKHSDPVWQVKWRSDDLDGNLTYVSVSSDGRVCVWTVAKSELSCAEVMQLMVYGVAGDGPDGTRLQTLGSGTAIDFHPEHEQTFLVGTEEGRILLCSLTHHSHYLGAFTAHQMSVYRVQWNPFHPDVFISCSADWSVKIWERAHTEPLFTFDLKSAVGDVAWAPYSATVFAAVTADGRVHVYDLSVNKYDAVCCQTIVHRRKTKLTRLAFNRRTSVVVVSDDRGAVASFKLSPNLRRAPRDKKGQELTRSAEAEVEKLERILQVVRENPKTSSLSLATSAVQWSNRARKKF